MEEVFQDRDKFAQEVRKVASPDVSRMGIEIVSFTIKDVYDKVEYLASLGRAQTANVKRDADIGVAEAHRDAGIEVRHFIAFSVQKRRSGHHSFACTWELSHLRLPSFERLIKSSPRWDNSNI